jgi:hypothetical protein
MTIKELKKQIENLPDNMDVFIGERVTEFKYGLANSGSVKEIDFHDEDDPENEDLQASEEGFILTEE